MLTIVETPTETETTTIEIQTTPLQQSILNMMELVRRDHWCRNTTTDGDGNACMLGLMQKVTRF